MVNLRDDRFALLREAMVNEQLITRGISDENVLQAMRKVPRHLFLPEELRDRAYEDRALPIGPDQTISQPYIVGLMLQAARLSRTDKVLEIGTGSGYQTALLSELAGSVFSIDLDPELSEQAQALVNKLGYSKIKFRCGDGYAGWPNEAPFDVVIVSAAPDHIPRELVKELKTGGRMLLPLGEEEQELILIEKSKDGLEVQELGQVRFVKMKETG